MQCSQVPSSLVFNYCSSHIMLDGQLKQMYSRKGTRETNWRNAHHYVLVHFSYFSLNNYLFCWLDLESEAALMTRGSAPVDTKSSQTGCHDKKRKSGKKPNIYLRCLYYFFFLKILKHCLICVYMTGEEVIPVVWGIFRHKSERIFSVSDQNNNLKGLPQH